jgi:hypothetical protein
MDAKLHSSAVLIFGAQPKQRTVLFMAQFVWCKNEERRIPAFRCLLCKDNCQPAQKGVADVDNSLEILLKSGKYRERFLMKRKAQIIEVDEHLFEGDVGVVERVEKSDEEQQLDGRVFLLEEGKLKPFSPEDYTTSILYQVIDSFRVESKLVRPEEPGNLVFEGRKPSKRTVPVMIAKQGEVTLFPSWEELEADPTPLAEAAEVMGVVPVRQIFVLKRR